MGSKYKDTHKFLSKDLFNAFGKQFCKHEVLWKPDPSWTECQIQLARHDAYKMLTQALNLSMEAVLELSEIFPAACLDLVSHYEKGSRTIADSPMPDWLMPMAERFKLHNVSMKDFVKGMCDSAWEGLMGVGGRGGEDSSPLLGPRAVARYASLRRVKKGQMLPVWRRVYKMCVVKLRASLAAGDCQGILPETLTMDRSEREIADLALLNDADITQISYLTPSKLRSLVILFQLIVAAKEFYDRVKKRMLDDIRNNEMTANNENVNKTNPMIGVCNETQRSTDSSKSTKTIGTYTYSTQNLVKEKVTECKQTDDIRGKVEGSSDEDLHTELNLSPDVLVISSDISDNEISNNDFEDGNDVIILKNKNQSKDSKNSYTRRFLDSNYNFKKNWYEKSKCNASEEQMEIWALVYTDFMKRGRSASLVSLQHRWVELLHRCRTALLNAWESNTYADTAMHPLLLVMAHRFPEIVTESLPTWRELVTNRQIVLESDIKHTIRKYLESDKVFLHINDKLVNHSLVKTYMNKNDLNDVHSQSNSNATNKHLTYQINNENPEILQFCNPDNNKVTDVETLAQKSGDDIEVNSNNCISTMLERIDPSKAKVSIIVEDDVDEDLNETLHLENVSNIEQDDTCLRKESNQIPHALGICNKDNIEKEIQDKLDDMIHKVNTHNDLFVTNNITLNDNNEKDEYLEEVGEEIFGNSEPECDEKLAEISRVVITPIEDLPEWKKHSRNGVIKCRNFSVKNFTKPVVINSDKLHKCRPYVNRNKVTCDIKSEKESDSHESDDCMKKEFRIKFEDDNFETDYDFSEDINNGITCQKYIELYSMTDEMRKTRIRLTKKLKLPRTYFSLNFWNLNSNIELMKLCKPLQIKLSKTLPRVAKRIPLSETAVSSRSMDTTPADAQRSSASREAVNSINSSDPSNLITTKQTDNSLSSDSNSSELLKILKTYTIEKKIPKQIAVDSATKNNLMDSIIETMRFTEKNNIDNSVCPLRSSEQISLQSSNQSELLGSSNTNISEIIPATDTFNNTQKATEEVSDNNKQISSHISLLPSKIHISSHSTKDLNTKHVQGMKNVRDVFAELGEKKELNVCGLKKMLHLLAKNSDRMANHEYSDDMKLSRQSLSSHLKKFEKEQNAFIEEITKRTKILPTYGIKEKSNVPKIKTKDKKRKKINLIQKEQTIQPSDTSGNIKDVAVDKNSVLVDDDNEPKLVIDERIEEPSGNNDSNNSQCNKMNTNIEKTSNETKKDKKEKRKRGKRRAIKRNRKLKNNSEEEKPALNEYQEWQRQKTMALKYFTLPTIDTSRLRTKDKIVISQSTGTQTQQSSSRQTNIPMKRGTTDLTEKSNDITKRPKLHGNDTDVFYISDDSSEDDVQIVESRMNTGTVNIDNTIMATAQIEINEIPKTNNVKNIQVPNQNVCVINTPMTSITQPLYLVISGNQMPMNTEESVTNRQETINNQVFLQVYSNGVAPFSNEIPIVPQNDVQKTQIILGDERNCYKTQSSNTPPCQRAINNRWKDDDLTCSLNVIQNVISDDSRTDKPSTSLLQKHLLKETLTVEEFIQDIKKPTALIKVDGSQNQLFFCNKYIILTDVNILSTNATYRTMVRSKKYKLLSQVLFPSGSGEGKALLLGPKADTDYLFCKCLVGLKIKCFLCHIVDSELPKCTNLFKIHEDYYKKISDNPLKCVRLNENDMVTNGRDVLEGNPDLMLFNRMYFKKLREKPLKYVRMLSSVPYVDLLRHLVFKGVPLYVLDVTQSQTKNYYKSLIYKRTGGNVTVRHSDDRLVRNLQLILNC